MRDPGTGGENLVNMQTDDLAANLSEQMLARGQHMRGYLEFFIPKPLPLSNGRIKAELFLTDSLNAVHRSGEQEIWYVGDGWRGGNMGQAHKSPGRL
jgi:hypothetical protein